MTISKEGLDLIKEFEGFRSKSYQDSVGIWTIGFGSTMWSDGKRVKGGQTITDEEAEKLLSWEVVNKTKTINALTQNVCINQNQFDALASFTYNLGVGALAKSTLIKKVHNNPNDESIRTEFMKWVNAGGRPLPGLIKRREREADLYFKPVTKQSS